MLRTTSRTIGKPGIPSREVSVNAPSEAPYEKPEKDTSLQTVETVGQLDAEVIHDLNEAVDGVLTKVVCRVVIPSKANEYERLHHELHHAAARFPGFLSMSLVAPRTSGPCEYISLIKFRGLGNMRRWDTSQELADYMDAIRSLEEAVQVEYSEDDFFAFPNLTATSPNSPLLKRPLKWRQALVTCLSLYPIVLFNTLVLQQFWEGVHDHPAVTLLFALPVSVAVNSYVAAPVFSWLFWSFIHPKQFGGPARPSTAQFAW